VQVVQLRGAVVALGLPTTPDVTAVVDTSCGTHKVEVSGFLRPGGGKPVPFGFVVHSACSGIEGEGAAAFTALLDLIECLAGGGASGGGGRGTLSGGPDTFSFRY
jgi:hypothetical protein